MRGFIQGACVVLFGGHAWFYSGGVHGFIWGACMVLWGGVRGFFSFFGYNEIRSMSGWYASYWNAFLFYILFKWHMTIFSYHMTQTFKTRMHSSRMHTVRSSSRLSRGGSASVHAGIPKPPGTNHPPRSRTPLEQEPPQGAGTPPVDRQTPVKT